QGPIGSSLGFLNPADQFLPDFNVGGVLNLGSTSNIPQRLVDNTFNWNASGAWHTSMHNFKFGVDIQHYRTNGFNNLFFGSLGTELFGPGATLSASVNPATFGTSNLFPNAFAAFLLGAPSANGTTFFNQSPSARQTWYAGWIGDTINIHRI